VAGMGGGSVGSLAAGGERKERKGWREGGREGGTEGGVE
jgi:hypothetical protein